MTAHTKDFESTALPYLDAVYRSAVALCGSQHDAEDLTQTTFTKALERFESYRSGTNCKAWLLRIMRNTWIDQFRRQKVLGAVLPLTEELVEAPSDAGETVWSNADDICSTTFPTIK